MKASKLLLAILLLLWPSGVWGFQVDHTSNMWVDYWGKLTIKGQSCQAGDEVAAFDPQGVCCGVSRVTPESAVASIYPFLHVYGDDPGTAVDEGASDGDLLTFRVYRASENRVYAAKVHAIPQDPGAPDPPKWVEPTGSLNSWTVDIAAEEAPEPVSAWDLVPGTPYDLVVEGTGTALDGLRIHIPAGALSQAVHLAVSLSNTGALPALPEGAFGFPFHLTPDGLDFLAAITITAPYGSQDPTGSVGVYRWAEGEAGWSTGGISNGSADLSANTVQFDTTKTGNYTPVSKAAVEPESSGGGGGGGGGCFIATAAFGSPLERHVAVLQTLRDRLLLACHPGRLFVAGYYSLSPAAARYISGHPRLRQPVRGVLYPLVALSSLVLGTLSLPPGLLGVALAAGALALARRRLS